MVKVRCKMDIPLNAEAFCSDGHVGRITNVILNPKTDVMSHLVVRLKENPHTEVVVSKELVRNTTSISIKLDCTCEQIKNEQSFVETDLIPVQIPQYPNAIAWPVAMPETSLKAYRHHHIPVNEKAVHSGVHVKALDGDVGQVDEFRANSDGHITHLVLRAGHLWRAKELEIPVSAVSHFGSRSVQLDLRKNEVNGFPLLPVRREFPGLQ